MVEDGNRGKTDVTAIGQGDVPHVRVTAKTLLTLPAESLGSTDEQDLLRRAKVTSDSDARSAILADLRFDAIEHDLLSDARVRLSGGLPDYHRAATAAAGEPVYEVRSRSGAAWRGAVVRDGDGVFWLVYAAKHDVFHNTVASVMKRDGWQPNALDQAVLEHDRAETERVARSVTILSDLIHALAGTVDTGAAERFTVAIPGRPTTASVEVSIEHDAPAASPEEADRSESSISLVLRIDADSDAVQRELIRTCVPFLQPNERHRDQVYGRQNSLELVMTVTHARLVQLTGDFALDSTRAAPVINPPDRLHYANVTATIEGFVLGRAVVALCGSWFVPSTSESSGLPICDECERVQPTAQRLLDQIRERVGQS